MGRRCIRLRNFDYGDPSSYFITICIKDRSGAFGFVQNGFMCLSALGTVTQCCLEQVGIRRRHIDLDEHVIMPDHLHLILRIWRKMDGRFIPNSMSGLRPASVSVVINLFKGAVRRWARENGYPDFEWLGRFHDRVIRDCWELDRVRKYIRDNPRNWVG